MAHGALLNVMWLPDEKAVWRRMDTCRCMVESLHCSPETITMLLIDSTTIQNKKLKKKCVCVCVCTFWQGVGERDGEGNGNPTPVLLPGKSQGQRSLVGCSPWGREELDTSEAT